MSHLDDVAHIQARIRDLEREPGLVVYPEDDARVRARKFRQEARRRSKLAALHEQAGEHAKAKDHKEWADVHSNDARAWGDAARQGKPVMTMSVGDATFAAMRREQVIQARMKGRRRGRERDQVRLRAACRRPRSLTIKRAPSSRRRRSGTTRSGCSPGREPDPDSDPSVPASRPCLRARTFGIGVSTGIRVVGGVILAFPRAVSAELEVLA